MAKQPRAKGANRPNPRADRNVGAIPGGRSGRGGRDNVSELNFPQKPKKQRIDIVPRNVHQEDMVAALKNPDKHVIFAIGPAGCGKTLLATLHAIKSLKAGLVEKIVITRPNIAVDDKDIGFLPGDIIKKMTPWMMPILDVFSEYYTQAEIQYMLEENVVEMVPIAYVRGRTFKNAYIIFDEAQNSTPSSMLSVLTRIGENSKMVITGDLAQGDRGQSNGLRDFVERFETRSEGIELIKFGAGDVERHPVIRELLGIYKDMPGTNF